MQPVEITAGRLHLRPWLPHDEQEHVAARNDPEVVRWTGAPAPYTPEHSRTFLTETGPQGWADGTAASWAVLDATTSGLLGSVGLHRISGGEAFVDYWCTPAARGRGTASEALQTVCRWGFAVLDLQRLSWEACVGNWASRAVAQKAGFTVEGVARRAFDQRGTRVDDWRGSLLPTDPMTDTRPLPAQVELTDGVVTLRRWRSTDAADVARACDDADTALWLPVPVPYTLEHGVAYVDVATPTAWADGTSADFAVVDARSGELFSSASLKLGLRASGVGEVGYWTAPWARGRGAARRATALLAAWGLGELGLSRVELLADVRNTASQSAALKAGMVREGVARRRMPDRDGVAQDMVLYSRTTP